VFVVEESARWTKQNSFSEFKGTVSRFAKFSFHSAVRLLSLSLVGCFSCCHGRLNGEFCLLFGFVSIVVSVGLVVC
jgi:hypothetical protein